MTTTTKKAKKQNKKQKHPVDLYVFVFDASGKRLAVTVFTQTLLLVDGERDVLKSKMIFNWLVLDVQLLFNCECCIRPNYISSNFK